MRVNNCPFGCGNQNCTVSLDGIFKMSKQKNKIKKMKSDFKLTGLSKPQSFTCEPLNGDTFFWAKNGLGKEKFNELWNYCDGNWQDNKIAEIEHEGLNEDGTPINPVVVGIREVS